MRIFWYELYKLFHQKVVVLACLGFVVANFFVFLVMEENTTTRYHYRGDTYKKFQDIYGTEQTPEERIETMEHLLDLLLFYSTDYWTEQGMYIKEEYQEHEMEMVNKYGKGILKELKDMRQEIDYQTSCCYSVYAGDWLKYAQYALKYNTFRREMKQRAETLQKISLFSKQGSFSNSNLIKTCQDFEHLGDVKISYNNQYGIRAYLRYNKYMPVFLFFTVLIFCAGIWQRDNEKKLLSLLKCKKKGKLSLYVVKVCTLFFCIFIMNIVYLLTIFFTASYLYGIDVSISIQSIENYRDCCWNLYVGQFMVLCGITQAVVWCVIGLVFFLCFQLFQRNTQIFGVCSILIVVCMGFYIFIQPNSLFSIFKYINPVYGVQPVKLYGTYQNMNVFGKAVSIFPVLLIFILLLFFAGSILGGILWCTGKRNDRFSKGIIHLKRKKIYGTRSILHVQLHEFLIHDKKIIFCVLLLVYGIYTAFFSSVYYIPEYEEEPNYKEYIQGLKGSLTEETEKKMEEREQFFKNVWERIEILSTKESLDAESYAEMVAMNTLCNIPYRAFQQLEEQYEYLKERKRQGEEAVFLDFYVWNRPFQSVAKEVKNLMLAILVTIFLSSSLFADHSNMKRLTVSMKKGRRSLWRRQYMLGIGTSILSWLCLIVPEAVRFIRQNDVSLSAAQIGNLPLFDKVRENVSIAAVMAGMYLCYLLVCMVAACVTMLFVDLSGNSFISMAVTMVPIILSSVILIRKKQGIFCSLAMQSILPMRNLCLIMAVMLILIGISIVLWEKEVFFPKGKRKAGHLI
ncbi:MAG: hypothetical protein K2N51_12705 [Lachnospiraceae bacterium]|nr:hypothetical protein [Lachnospiraceae bacterium]